ncbi:MAG: branched-chain amino acid ABC transporter permease [Nitrososphaerota archaeon]
MASLPLLFAFNSAIMTILTLTLYIAVVALNWNLLFGHAGVWSIGQLGFFAIGAYSSAFISKAWASPLIGIIVGVLVAVLISLGLSFATLKLRATYFALATFGFQEVVRGIILVIHPSTIFDLPHLEILNLSFILYNGLGYYYSFLLLLFVTLVVHMIVLTSSVGTAVIALRYSELRAVSLGVDVVKTRGILFAISAALTSCAGSLYAHYTNSVGVAILGFDNFLLYFVILAFGGIGSFYGPLVSSFLWTILDFPLRIYYAEMRLIIMGCLVLLILMFLEKGITDIWKKIIAAISKL